MSATPRPVRSSSRVIAGTGPAPTMQAMRPRVERIAERLLDDLGERDRLDVVADYAGLLPCLVIMAMLGVPAEEMAGFFERLIDDRRRMPRRDALSELVHLCDDGDAFTDDELVATCIMMPIAGHETATNHIANGHSIPRTKRRPSQASADPGDAAADAAGEVHRAAVRVMRSSADRPSGACGRRPPYCPANLVATPCSIASRTPPPRSPLRD